MWCLRTYIPILTALSRFAREKRGTKVPTPPRKGDLKWFLTSLFGLGGAGAVAAAYLSGKLGVGLYFIGLFLGFAPVLAVLLIKLLIILALGYRGASYHVAALGLPLAGDRAGFASCAQGLHQVTADMVLDVVPRRKFD